MPDATPHDPKVVVVDADLRLAEHPNAFALGEAAAVRSQSGPLQPQVAQVAVQGGRHAARQIERLIAGRLHVAYLPGMANRLRALQTWRWWHVTHEANARVLIDDRAEPEPARAELERPPTAADRSS